MTLPHSQIDDAAGEVRPTAIYVASQISIPHGCSICGTVGRLRRGWCTLHYQRWHRNGDPLKLAADLDENGKARAVFTLAMWKTWLDELNAGPDIHAQEDIHSVRISIENHHGSKWNKHPIAPWRARHKGER